MKMKDGIKEEKQNSKKGSKRNEERGGEGE